MLAEFEKQLSQTLEEIKSQGLYKTERVITTPQDAHIAVAGGKRVLNMCANNYLGLADHPELIKAAKTALDTHGLGMASVRFICGTQDLHKELEARSATFRSAPDKSRARDIKPGKTASAKSGGRTYIVQSGVTLASISRKFYKSSARWEKILNANKESLHNPENLKVGQSLIIP